MDEILRKEVANSDESRINRVLEICRQHRRVIVFYNHTYESHSLRDALVGEVDDIGEWNGEVHTPVPSSERGSWVYLVQYLATSEGWNRIRTNRIVFYSQDYSYRRTKQDGRKIVEKEYRKERNHVFLHGVIVWDLES